VRLVEPRLVRAALAQQLAVGKRQALDRQLAVVQPAWVAGKRSVVVQLARAGGSQPVLVRSARVRQ
jgi:hypothetical protein